MLEEMIAEALWRQREPALQAAMIRRELLYGVGRLPPLPSRRQAERATARRGLWARLTFARE